MIAASFKTPTTERRCLNTWICGEFEGSAELSISSSCASAHMKHVNSEGVETRDIDTPREGPHYAVRPLSLILISQDKKKGIYSVSECKSILTISAMRTASRHIDIPNSCLSWINLRAAHLFIELDLVLQDDPVGSIRLLPRQQQTVPGDISGLDRRHWRGCWEERNMMRTNTKTIV